MSRVLKLRSRDSSTPAQPPRPAVSPRREAGGHSLLWLWLRRVRPGWSWPRVRGSDYHQRHHARGRPLRLADGLLGAFQPSRWLTGFLERFRGMGLKRTYSLERGARRGHSQRGFAYSWAPCTSIP